MPRYTQKPFPAYRFVPTKSPHPVIHPDGHSFGKKEEKINFLAPEQWANNQAYLYGVDLFNHGYWWEAHEAWENVWLTTQKSDLYGQYLQGLIQFSAAFLKLYQGSQRGFFNLFTEASKRWNFCLTELNKLSSIQFMGLNLKEWKTKSENFRSQVSANDWVNFDALSSKDFPFLKLNLTSHATKR